MKSKIHFDNTLRFQHLSTNTAHTVEGPLYFTIKPQSIEFQVHVHRQSSTYIYMLVLSDIPCISIVTWNLLACVILDSVVLCCFIHKAGAHVGAIEACEFALCWKLNSVLVLPRRVYQIFRDYIYLRHRGAICKYQVQRAPPFEGTRPWFKCECRMLHV